jgi:hypothetical protein
MGPGFRRGDDDTPVIPAKAGIHFLQELTRRRFSGSPLHRKRNAPGMIPEQLRETTVTRYPSPAAGGMDAVVATASSPNYRKKKVVRRKPGSICLLRHRQRLSKQRSHHCHSTVPDTTATASQMMRCKAAIP